MCTMYLSWSYWLPVPFPFHLDPHTNPFYLHSWVPICAAYMCMVVGPSTYYRWFTRDHSPQECLISTAAPTAGSLPSRGLRVRSCEVSDSVCARPCHVQVTAFHSFPRPPRQPQAPFSLGQRVDKDLSVSFGHSVVTFLSFLTSHINCCPLKIDISLTKGWELHQSVVIRISIYLLAMWAFSWQCECLVQHQLSSSQHWSLPGHSRPTVADKNSLPWSRP